MAIGAIELSTIARTPDYTTVKHNEDMKGMVDQGNFQTQFQKTVDEKTHTVKQGDNADRQEKKFDAKEKGNGTYGRNGNGQNRRKEQDCDDKVILKQPGGFDIKI